MSETRPGGSILDRARQRQRERERQSGLHYRRRSMSAAEIEDFIQAHEWKFAKTMPATPHSYVVRDRCRSEAELERFVMHIRRHGYRAKFGKFYYTYFDWPVDGVMYQFWSMGAPVHKTIIINRAVKK